MLHQKAIEVRRELITNGSHFVTTNLVLAELCNAFSPPNLRGTAILQIDSIEHSSRWRVVEMDSRLWRESFTLYCKMIDKSWGLVDCASIIIARRLEILTAFTADHHFAQAGFNILLK